MTSTTNRYTKLLHHEAVPGILLIIAMIAALIVANSGVSWYGAMLDTIANVSIGNWAIHKPLLLWINDGLMAVFFLLVGLELKREVLFGELSQVRKIILPIFAAIGGILIPSGIYAAMNWNDPLALNGWAIPAATDIAFALGVLAVLGSRIPVALKILLTSIAVLDDLAAIVIIALFYTNQLSLVALGSAGLALVGLFLLNRAKVQSVGIYVILGIILWITVLKSGVHATLAGVALAAFIPAGNQSNRKASPAHSMEKALHPWVVFGILPIFAFANAGVPILGLSFSMLLEPVPLGIALGLFIGKQTGVFAGSWIAVKCGLAELPSQVNWRQIYGLSALCGIGFTMSLFVGSLAFEGSGGPDYKVDDRIGILAGSFLSALLGVIILLIPNKKSAGTA
ncbi:MAG: NhaA family Na+:H+ antiporter [Candidatus Pelagisphaera sp.]|jgi:NhaA family Na+:H+ antiporter